MTRKDFIKIFGECPFKMARKGHKFTDPEILRITDINSWTIAHSMAMKNYKFTDPEILKLVDKYGVIVENITDRY